MRTENSIKNIFSGFASNIVTSLLSFVSRTVFIKTIGKLYLGVNGLLSNVLGLLSLTELGIGLAINYSLYKPLAEKDDDKVLSLMNFYKKCYRIIALVVACIGLVILPFLNVIIKEASTIPNLKLIYLIFLFNMVIGYLFSYKRTIVVADQKSYKLIPYTISFSIITVVSQIIVLLIFKNYFAYLLINSFFIILENVVINKFINKTYPILQTDTKNIKPVDTGEMEVIKRNVKALLFHKIGETCVTSTDNIIISAVISVSVVGIYSNYSVIFGIISSLLLIIFNSLTASFGNLIVKENSQKRLNTFLVMNFLASCLYGISSICFLILFNPFITLWIGSDYLLDMFTVSVLVINFYMTGLRIPLAIVKAAAGIYNEDKYIPIIQSAVNLVVSLVLAYKIGIIGVFIGTVVSGLIPSIQRAILVYKMVFKEKSINYFKNYMKFLLIFVISYLIVYKLDLLLNIPTNVLGLFMKLLLSVTIPTIILIILFYKTSEYKRIKEIIYNIFGRLKCKKRSV